MAHLANDGYYRPYLVLMDQNGARMVLLCLDVYGFFWIKMAPVAQNLYQLIVMVSDRSTCLLGLMMVLNGS